MSSKETSVGLDFTGTAREYRLPITSDGYVALTFERDWPAVWIEPRNLQHFALPPDLLRSLADEIDKRHAEKPTGRLEWVDAQGDRFQIEPESTVASPSVIAGILVGDHKDGQEAAVWVDEEDARQLIAWLRARLGEV